MVISVLFVSFSRFFFRCVLIALVTQVVSCAGVQRQDVTKYQGAAIATCDVSVSDLVVTSTCTSDNEILTAIVPFATPYRLAQLQPYFASAGLADPDGSGEQILSVFYQ